MSMPAALERMYASAIRPDARSMPIAGRSALRPRVAAAGADQVTPSAEEATKAEFDTSPTPPEQVLNLRGVRRVAKLGPGDFFGEMALLSQAPRSATVTALTPLDVLVITDRAFVGLLDRMPEIWLKVARALAERVHADESRDR
jgi:hypothetical protein